MGLSLTLVGVVATGWLAATGQLGLYIHPRYNVFTIGMTVLGGIAAIAGFVAVGQRGRAGRGHDPHEHEHEHEHGDGEQEPRTPLGRAARFAGALLLASATAGALLVLPPATLTTATVDQRDINAAAVADAEPVQLAGADTSEFTVRDWAMLLRQGADAEFLSGKKPELLGFVTPFPDDPDNVFYVARFTVTCCAVDAQPVGVPVYLPGWQDRFAVDSWVLVTGSFIDNPSGAGLQAVVLEPASVEPAQQPADPYVY